MPPSSPGPLPKVPLSLSRPEYDLLVRRVRCQTAPLSEVHRAQIVLRDPRRWPDAAIARHVHLAENPARLRHRQYAEEPEHSLADRSARAGLAATPTSTAPPSLPPPANSPRDGGPLSRFSDADIAQEIHPELPAAPSRSTIVRWLSANSLRPGRHRCWKFPRDPNPKVSFYQFVDRVIA